MGTRRGWGGFREEPQPCSRTTDAAKDQGKEFFPLVRMPTMSESLLHILAVQAWSTLSL